MERKFKGGKRNVCEWNNHDDRYLRISLRELRISVILGDKRIKRIG